ncbi:MAG: hypothetical protein DRN24_05230 [Thermoplasmata archaeon]|nr:MAG: hypothetical protein DRN24_05230 [Thermoplasmata archaeon]
MITILVISIMIMMPFTAVTPAITTINKNQTNGKNLEKEKRTNCFGFWDWNLDVSFDQLEYLKYKKINGEDYSIYKLKYTITNIGKRWCIGWPCTYVRRNDSLKIVDIWNERFIVLLPGRTRSFSHEIKVKSSPDPDVDKERYFANHNIVLQTSTPEKPPEGGLEPPYINGDDRLAKYWNDNLDYQPTEPHLIVSTPWKYNIVNTSEIFYLEIPDVENLPDVIKNQRLGWIADLVYYLRNIAETVKTIIIETDDEKFILEAWNHLEHIQNWIIDVCEWFKLLVRGKYSEYDPLDLISLFYKFQNITDEHVSALINLSIEFFGEVTPSIQAIVNISEAYSKWQQTEPWTKPILIKGQVEGVKNDEVINVSCRSETYTCKDEDDGKIDNISHFEFYVTSDPTQIEASYIVPHNCTITIKGDKHDKTLCTVSLLSYCFSDGIVYANFSKEDWKESKNIYRGTTESTKKRLKGSGSLNWLKNKPFFNFIKNTLEVSRQKVIWQDNNCDIDYDFDKLLKEAIEEERKEKTIEGMVLKEYYPGAPWDDPKVVYYAPNEAIVGFKSYVDVSKIKEVKGQDVIDYIKEYHSVLVKVSGVDLEDFINEVEKEEDVEYAELNSICQAHGGIVALSNPNDPRFDEQWGHKMIKLPQAWEYPRLMKNVWVGIMDSGIDIPIHFFPVHEDLEYCKIVNLDFYGLYGVDLHGHGTLMAGIILAQMNNGKGIAGVAGDIGHAFNIKVLDLDIYSGKAITKDYIVAKALRHSTFITQPQVLSMCFGSYYPSIHRRLACKIAAERGVLLIASAGNGACETVEFPARYDTVISVGAINENMELCDYEEWGSNYGPDVDIVAPGVNILSTNRMAGYSYCWGTSAAAAYVVGVALLWYGVRAASRSLPHVKLEPDKCKKALLENARYLGEDCGYGLVDALETVKDAPVDRNRGLFR